MHVLGSRPASMRYKRKQPPAGLCHRLANVVHEAFLKGRRRQIPTLFYHSLLEPSCEKDKMQNDNSPSHSITVILSL